MPLEALRDRACRGSGSRSGVPRRPGRRARRERRVPRRPLRPPSLRHGRDAAGHAEVATDDEIARCAPCSASRSPPAGSGFRPPVATHSDGEGEPVASRYAARRERCWPCAEVRRARGRHAGVHLQRLPRHVLRRGDRPDGGHDRDRRATAQLERPHHRRPIRTKGGPPAGGVERGAAAGGRIVALTMPALVPMNMSFLNHCALFLIPGWGDVLGLPVAERTAQLRDPEVRRRPRRRRQQQGGRRLPRLARLGQLRDRRHLFEANRGWSGGRSRTSPPSAAASSSTPSSTSVLADGLRTDAVAPAAPTATTPAGGLRRRSWEDPRAMLGGSDAGAHLDRMCGATYPTAFLGDMPAPAQARARRAGRPAHDRGAGAAVRAARPGAGGAGDATPTCSCSTRRPIGSEPARLVHDLPGGSAAPDGRLDRRGAGPGERGRDDRRRHAPPGALPGVVLRSGRDTASVSTSTA